jgi:hypothetical protein
MKFEVGKTYQTRSIGDHNCIISVRIVKRTAKTVTTSEGKTFRPYIDTEGREVVKPWGSYSMSPIVRADDTATLRTDWETPAPAAVL